VRAAAQLDVPNRGFPAGGERDDVVERQEAALGAAPIGADERAPSAIALPDPPPDGRRNMTGPRR